MAAAIPCLQEEFGLERQEARNILRQWRKTFDDRHPVVTVSQEVQG